MGRGDKRTRRGKIAAGSYGNSRVKAAKRKRANAAKAKKAKK